MSGQIQELGYGASSILYKVATADGLPLAWKRNLTVHNSDFVSSIRELNLLKLLDHPFIVKLVEVVFDNIDSTLPINRPCHEGMKDDSAHFIFELADMNFSEFYASLDSNVWLYLKKILMDVLLALEYIHDRGIVHRDLKSGNILVFFEQNCGKLADFGFAKFKPVVDTFSPYVATHIYRAPEIITESNSYNSKSDMWSFGCILVECLIRKWCLYTQIDTPEYVATAMIQQLPEECVSSFRNSLPSKLRSLPRSETLTWEEKIGFSQERIDLFNSETQFGDWNSYLEMLRGCMTIDPEKRWTATQCLESNFFAPQREYIRQIRELARQKEIQVQREIVIENPIIKINLRDFIMSLFNSRKDHYWYSHRILFHAIAYLDRYLTELKRSHDESFLSSLDKSSQMRYSKLSLANKELDKLFIDLDPRLVLELKLVVCLYMSIKYFLPVGYSMFNFTSFTLISDDMRRLGEEGLRKCASAFEMLLIVHVMDFRVYQSTVYDEINQEMSDEEIKDILRIYLTCDCFKGHPASEILSKYRFLKENKINRSSSLDERRKAYNHYRNLYSSQTTTGT